MPKSNVPIRICGSKTRTGCRTCKQRHVKCDERRPICLRCQKAHRQCDYDPSQPHTRAVSEEPDPTTSILPQSTTLVESPIATGNISPHGHRKLMELVAVRTFTTHLGKDLAGCFSDDVWCRIFPLVAQHETSIWHAVAAISMLDTSIQVGRTLDTSNPEVIEAIGQYNKAIQKLNMQLVSKENPYYKDIVLLCCILFAVFECLRNHFQSALRHISGGMKLLMEWEKDAHSNGQGYSSGYFDRSTLRPILLSLDSQVVQMGAVDFREFNSLPAIEDERTVPISFLTVQDAHVSLTGIFNRLSRWTDKIDIGTSFACRPEDDWLNLEKHRLQTELAEWDSTFESSRERFGLQSATALLSIQKRTMQTIFDKELDGPSEMEWDKYLPRFEEAIIDAEVFLVLENGEQQSVSSGSDFRPQDSVRRQRSVLTVTMDIVLSLYLISTRCRFSQLRRKALNMLRSCRRREGIWDSYLCSQIAETIIELEEAAATDDGHIPESARVWQLECSYGKSETATIRHKKLLPNGDGSYRVETFG